MNRRSVLAALASFWGLISLRATPETFKPPEQRMEYGGLVVDHWNRLLKLTGTGRNVTASEIRRSVRAMADLGWQVSRDSSVFPAGVLNPEWEAGFRECKPEAMFATPRPDGKFVLIVLEFWKPWARKESAIRAAYNNIARDTRVTN